MEKLLGWGTLGLVLRESEVRVFIVFGGVVLSTGEWGSCFISSLIKHI